MNIEIEHKYLVNDDSYKQLATSKLHIAQGYLSRDKQRTVRIRTIDKTGFITIKTINVGDTRNEFEYEIPYDDALKLLSICLHPIIEKYRYVVNYAGFKWEIDEFKRELDGLVLAEIELPTSATKYSIPPFVGENVTGNPKYYNSNIHKLIHNAD